MAKSIIAALSVMIVTSVPADAQALVAQIFEHYQTECNEMQPDLPAIDEDISDQGPPELRPLESTVYDIQLTPNGKTGTVVYPDFWCENAGHPFCGTGGCGFYIIVDDKVFERQGGHRPHSIASEKGVYVIIPIHGSGCEDSTGQNGAGANSCSVVAIWDDNAETFRSKAGEISHTKIPF
jgi:hypothetical protein